MVGEFQNPVNGSAHRRVAWLVSSKIPDKRVPVPDGRADPVRAARRPASRRVGPAADADDR